MKFAQKFTAGYVQGEYGYSAWTFLKKNPVIKTLHIINYSAGSTIKELEAQKAAAGFLHYFESIEITHSDKFDLVKAKDALTALIKSGKEKAQELGNVIDEHYTFDDERAA